MGGGGGSNASNANFPGLGGYRQKICNLPVYPFVYNTIHQDIFIKQSLQVKQLVPQLIIHYVDASDRLFSRDASRVVNYQYCKP